MAQATTFEHGQSIVDRIVDAGFQPFRLHLNNSVVRGDAVLSYFYSTFSCDLF
jgi:hypothetical protein